MFNSTLTLNPRDHRTQTKVEFDGKGNPYFVVRAWDVGTGSQVLLVFHDGQQFQKHVQQGVDALELSRRIDTRTPAIDRKRDFQVEATAAALDAVERTLAQVRGIMEQRDSKEEKVA